MKNFDRISDSVVFEVTRLYFAGQGASDIAEFVSERRNVSVKRQDVYPIIREARLRGLMSLIPPRDQSLAGELIAHFGLEGVEAASTGLSPAMDRRAIYVSDTPRASATEDTAGDAAEVVVGLIRDLRVNGKKEVHIGLASGGTTGECSFKLAQLLRREPELPRLVFHALTPGYSVVSPQTAAAAFFSYFENLPDVGFVGLPAPPFVPIKLVDEIKRWPGIAKSLEYKREIDIVITSLASSTDLHGELKWFMRESGSFGGRRPDSDEVLEQIDLTPLVQTRMAELNRQHWAGDVQTWPFNLHGPIDHPAMDYTAVTLFNLGELVKLAAQPGTAVVLIVAPCGICGKSRSRGAVPLIATPSLAVWSHLCINTLSCQRAIADWETMTRQAGGSS